MRLMLYQMEVLNSILVLLLAIICVFNCLYHSFHKLKLEYYQSLKVSCDILTRQRMLDNKLRSHGSVFSVHVVRKGF